MGVDAGTISKSGAFLSFGETRLGQGRENAKAFLREHADVAAQIEALIKGETTPQPSTDEPADQPVAVAASQQSD